MFKFKIGDKVKCIDLQESKNITLNKTYTVLECFYFYDSFWITVISDILEEETYPVERFNHV